MRGNLPSATIKGGKISNVREENSQKEPKTEAFVDWNKPFLCQKESSEKLQYPQNSKRIDIGYGKGYQSLADNIK